MRLYSLPPGGRITAIPAAHRIHMPMSQVYLEKAKGSGLAWWIINVLFSKAKQHLELFACYLALYVLDKYCHTLQNKIAQSVHMECHKIQAHTKAWLCLYHLGMKRQTATLKHRANTALTTFCFQLAILSTNKYTNSDWSLKWVGCSQTWLTMQKCSQEEVKMLLALAFHMSSCNFLLWSWSLINPAMCLEDSYRKTLHTVSVVITTINCTLSLSHSSCQGLLQLNMLL